MNYAPIARILIRYGAAGIVGAAQADALSADKDLVTVLAVALAAGVEAFYALAKKKGWST